MNTYYDSDPRDPTDPGEDDPSPPPEGTEIDDNGEPIHG